MVDIQHADPAQKIWFEGSFGSVGEFIDALPSGAYGEPLHHSTHEAGPNEPEPDWSFNTDYEGALELSRKGWVEGLEGVTQLGALAPVTRPDTRRRVVNNIAGYRPDVPMYVSGSPACMQTVQTVQTGRPVVRVALQACGYANTPSDHFVNWGAGVASLVDRLELDGHSVELVLHYASRLRQRVDDGPIVLRITLKRAGQVLDLDTLAFTLCHPAFMRRLVFRWRDGLDTGAPGHIGLIMDQAWQDAIAPGYDLYIAGLHNHPVERSTPARAQEFFQAQAEAFATGQMQFGGRV